MLVSNRWPMSGYDRPFSKEVMNERVPAGSHVTLPPTELSKEARYHKVIKKIALVTWEDITAYTRVEIPDDFEIYRLSKITVGILWRESPDYVVLVQDYDLSNRGKGYRHNDFHIIPRGIIKKIEILGEVQL